MSYLERRKEILKYLKNNGTASVHRLSKELYASEATIRRDLSKLEEEGKIKRTFGGAVLVNLLNKEIPLSLREHEHPEEKKIIASKAIHYIHDGYTIFLDASSTCYYLAEQLTNYSDLTVVTNSPKTSLALGVKNISCYCSGGLQLPNSIAYIGIKTCEYFKRFNPDVVFISCRGLSPDGYLCDSSIEEAEVKEALLCNSGKKVFLCDSSKFGQTYRYNIAHISEMDIIITESKLPSRYQKMLKK